MNATPAALFCALSVICGLFSFCDSQTTRSINETSFDLPDQNNPVYLLSKRYFLLIPGDTAFLYGTEACTVITNGEITSVRADSLYFRTITKKHELLFIDGKQHVVIPQIFQQDNDSTSLDGSSIVRYFEQSPTGIRQVAYARGDERHFPDSARQTIIPNPMEIGSFGSVSSPRNSWATSHLIPCPFEDTMAGLLFEGRSVANKVLALTSSGIPYVVRRYPYWDGMELKTYYTLNGTRIEKGEHVFVVGTITVTSTYFVDRGLVDQTQEWRLHQCRADGEMMVTRKTIYLGRGPGGTRLYPDYDTSKVF
ncbi:MAG: hypothetical protein JXA71_09850 [Chitinispirillaceae bacterium]|nr:hypothetical protein [Chitinispirillaceae bacterium]